MNINLMMLVAFALLSATILVSEWRLRARRRHQTRVMAKVRAAYIAECEESERIRAGVAAGAQWLTRLDPTLNDSGLIDRTPVEMASSRVSV